MRLCALLMCLMYTQVEALDAVPANLFENLTFRYVGPPGNRVPAVVGVPGSPEIYYLGAASGGVFKSVDGGHQWQPVFDDQPAASIGALAVSGPVGNTVWVGTGESFIRSNVSMGNGVYLSTDGGKNFSHRGLDQTGRIARIVLDPRDRAVAYVAALGHLYGPQADRGIFKTSDGGKTWSHVLFVDANTGASDLVMDPNNPEILFAGMWQMEMNTWSRTSGGPGSAIYMTRNGGETWKRLAGNGLPKPPWGKVGLTMSAADSRKIYALIETNSNPDFQPGEPMEQFAGVLWRSDDGGDSWSRASSDNRLSQRPLYYNRALASPSDAHEIHFLATQHTRSLDSGRSIENVGSGYDHHDMWIDPANTKRMIVGHDGGVSLSQDGGEHWFRPQLPIAQMYHVQTDDSIPYFLYGNRQDGPSTRGPSNTLTGGAIPIGEWRSVGGCEVGFAIPSTAKPNVVWSGCYDGILERYDLDTNLATDVSVWPEAAEGWAASDLKYRFQWTFPMALSPHDGSTLYVGSQFLHRTSDLGHSWQVISPDLTSNSPELQKRSGGLTLDDAGPTVAPTLFAIAESPAEQGVIWTGSNDGRLQLTLDAGANWQDVTGSLRGLPPRGTISHIEPSRSDAATAYVAVDRHQLGDFKPYLYRTTDYGKRWRLITDGIEHGLLSYAHTIIEHPKRPGLLFAGTENGLFVSFNAGEQWHTMQGNLPHVPVHGLQVQKRFNDLVIATYGRGFWILDELAALEQLSETSLEAPITLFEPRENWRFQSRETAFAQPDDPAAGQDPEYGVALDYYVPQNLEGAASLVISDQNGNVIRTITDLDSAAGLHRVFWDLTYDRTDAPELRNRPKGHSDLALPNKGWRSLRDGSPWAMLVPPGRYQAEFATADHAETVAVTVLKDPHTAGDENAISRQMELLTPLRDQINETVAMINELEWVRSQLALVKTRLQERDQDESRDQLIAEVQAVVDSSSALESRFFDLRMTDAGQDTLRWERRLYARQLYLARRIQRSDNSPTQSQQAVHKLLEQRFRAAAEAYGQLLSGPVAELNKTLIDHQTGPVVLNAGW